MTILTKAARAVAKVQRGPKSSFTANDVRLVLAVIRAIREPDREMVRVGNIDIAATCGECPCHTYDLGEEQARQVWQAMIDHMTGEGRG